MVADSLQKRHQASIDLSSNVLRIGSTAIPFLAEHELPAHARREGEQEMAEELGEAASQRNQAGLASPATAASSTGRAFPGAGRALGQPKVKNEPNTGTSHELASMGGGAAAQRPQFPEADITTVSFKNVIPMQN